MPHLHPDVMNTMSVLVFHVSYLFFTISCTVLNNICTCLLNNVSSLFSVMVMEILALTATDLSRTQSLVGVGGVSSYLHEDSSAGNAGRTEKGNTRNTCLAVRVRISET